MSEWAMLPEAMPRCLSVPSFHHTKGEDPDEMDYP